MSENPLFLEIYVINIQFMTFEKFNINHQSFLTKWSEDQATLEHLGGMFPLDEFIKFLLTAENSLSYIVIHNSKKIGIVDIEFYPKEKTAAISILIAPEERGKGFGKIVLEKLVQLNAFNNYTQLDAFIEHKNIASIRCFEKAGFRKIKNEVDEDGMFQFSYFF